MKKFIKQSVVILGGNIVLNFLADNALLLFTWHPIIGALPAALALPGIILQPWFIAFDLLPAISFLSPFLTTAITVLIYGSLNRSGRLERAKIILSNLNRRRAISDAWVFMAIGLTIAYIWYIDFPMVSHGIPKDIQLEYHVKEIDLKVSDSRYYTLENFIDSEWLWQARLENKELYRLTAELNLKPLKKDQITNAFIKMPPYWWHPVVTRETKIYGTGNFPKIGRGPDGWHALAIWNPKTQVLNMWIVDNF